MHSSFAAANLRLRIVYVRKDSSDLHMFLTVSNLSPIMLSYNISFLRLCYPRAELQLTGRLGA